MAFAEVLQGLGAAPVNNCACPILIVRRHRYITLMKVLIRSAILVTVMTACVWVSLFHPPFWQPSGPRDTLSRGANMAVSIFSLALLLRGGFRWSIVELMVSVLWSPITAFFAVGLVGGMTWSENIASLNQKALFTMVVYLCTPFMLGVLCGSLLLTLREKISR